MESSLGECYLYVVESKQYSVHRFVFGEFVAVNYDRIFLSCLVYLFSYDREYLLCIFIPLNLRL